MYCPNCGAKIDAQFGKAAFCGQCGEPLGTVGIQMQESPPAKDKLKAVLSNIAAFFARIYARASSAVVELIGGFGSWDIKKKVIAVVLVAAMLLGVAGGIVGCVVCSREDERLWASGSSFAMLDFRYTDRSVNDGGGAVLAVKDAAGMMGWRNAANELAVQSVSTVDDTTYYRMRQYHMGIPVYGKAAVVAAGSDGAVVSLSGNIDDVFVDLNAERLSQDEIGGSLASHILELTGNDASLSIATDSFSDDRLIIYASDDAPARLAYYTNVIYSTTSLVACCGCCIDAITGEVLSLKNLLITSKDECSFNTSVDASAVLSALTYETSTLSGYDSTTVEIFKFENGTISVDEVPSLKDSGYYEHDPLWILKYFDKDNLEAVINYNLARSMGSEGAWEEDDARILNDTISNSIDFYATLGRKGFDGKNSPINVYYNDMWDNGNNAYALSASYWGKEDPMELRKLGLLHMLGKGVLSFGANMPLNDCSLAGHEFTHLVNGAIWKPTGGGECGSVDEATCDIFGELIEAYTTGSTDWTRGDRVLRSPRDRTYSVNNETYRYPDYYRADGWVDTSSQIDGGGCHYNSTVLSHAAYLMTQNSSGVPLSGLSNDQLVKLWYRAMHMFPSECSFSQCRSCVETAAKAMYNNDRTLSAEQLKRVSEAFDAVGIASAVPTYTIRPNAELVVYNSDTSRCDEYIISIQSIDGKAYEYYDVVLQPGFRFPGELTGGVYMVTLFDPEAEQRVVFRVNISSAHDEDKIEIYTPFKYTGRAAEERALNENQRKAYLAYYDICQSYIEKHGEPVVVRVDSSAMSGDKHTRAKLGGLGLVVLRDFSGDGVEDMLCGYAVGDMFVYDVWIWDGSQAVLVRGDTAASVMMDGRQGVIVGECEGVSYVMDAEFDGYCVSVTTFNDGVPYVMCSYTAQADEYNGMLLRSCWLDGAQVTELVYNAALDELIGASRITVFSILANDAEYSFRNIGDVYGTEATYAHTLLELHLLSIVASRQDSTAGDDSSVTTTTNGSGEPAEDALEQSRTAAFAAYADVCRSYIDRYGQPAANTLDQLSVDLGSGKAVRIEGLGVVLLRDFSGDGVEDLLCGYATQGAGAYDVWIWNGERAVLAREGVPFGSQLEGCSGIIIGESDAAAYSIDARNDNFCVSVTTYADGVANEVYSAQGSYDDDGMLVRSCRIDGSEASEEAYDGALAELFSASMLTAYNTCETYEQYSFRAGCAVVGVPETLEQTAKALELLGVSIEPPAEAENDYESTKAQARLYYSAILSEYRLADDNGFWLGDDEERARQAPHVSPDMAEYYRYMSESGYRMTIYCTLVELNGDGVPELIVAAANDSDTSPPLEYTIFDMYSIIDGDFVPIFDHSSMGMNMTYSIHAGGIVSCVTGSPGYPDSEDFYSLLPDGTYKSIESIIYDRSNDEPVITHNGAVVTGDEFSRLLDSIAARFPSVMNELNWIEVKYVR